VSALKNISTIMITDIVGYSKMSGDNQDRALELLKEHDEILFGALEKYKGNILKNRGDGVIAQFNKPLESIECAVDVQRKLKKRNSLNIKERKLRVRIGIHYGEFIKEGDDIHGDCINIASKLEPLAPYGSILISKELSKLIVNYENIYIREYEKFKIDGNEELTYEIYIDLIEWYKNKNCKKSFYLKNDLFNKAHDYFHSGDFSASIKNSVLYNENISEDSKSNVDSFLSNLFINIGELEQAEILLKSVINKDSNDQKLKGHILKLKGHLFFNKEMWNKANEFYDQSLEIFIKEKSKYVNEIIFFKIMIDIINEERNISIKDKVNDIFIEDSYFELINIMENYFENDKEDYDQDIDFNRVEKLENNRYKAYGIWLMSKIMSQLDKMDRAYEFETKAQQFIKLSSLDISDQYIRGQYLENILIHRIIMTETSITVDNLFDFNEDNYDEFEGLIDLSTFNFCVKCGKENDQKNQKCNDCETVLIKEYYEKN